MKQELEVFCKPLKMVPNFEAQLVELSEEEVVDMAYLVHQNH